MNLDIKCLSKRETKPVIAICRLCISFTECAQSINYLSHFLSDILPNLDLTLSNDPVVCINCANSLATSFNFKKMCIETERRIREYYNKMKNTINLITMIQQTCDTVSNLPKNGFVNNIASANIAGDIIKIEELDLPFIEEKPSIDSDVPEISFNLSSGDKKDNHKSMFIKKEQRTIKLEESKENLYKSFNKTKEEVSEIDEQIGTVNKITFKECDELVDSNHYSMSNVVEIVESDIVSDIDISEDEEFTTFKEFCCKTKDNNASNNALEPSESVQVIIQNIKTIEHIGSDSESRDSDMIFIEDCGNQNTSNVTSTGVTGTKVVKEEVNASSHRTNLKSNLMAHVARKHDQPDKSKAAKIKIAGNLYKKVSGGLFKCVLCTKTFTQKLHLDGHLLTKHKNIPDIEKKVTSKIHFCDYCSYRTINNHNLAKHVVSKHNKISTEYKLKFKTFSCEHCEYSTQNKGNLIMHARRHNKVKPFPCFFCEESFHQKSHLDNHFFKCHADAMTVGKKKKIERY